MKARKGHKGKWECASVEAALETTGILSIREYMRRWQAIIAEYVSGRTIYELFTGEDWMEGLNRFLRWWDQYHGLNQTEREV